MIAAHRRPPFRNTTRPMNIKSPPQAMAMRPSMVIFFASLSLFLTNRVPQCLQQDTLLEMFFPHFGHFIDQTYNKKNSSGVVP